jgi:hypothetical protein
MPSERIVNNSVQLYFVVASSGPTWSKGSLGNAHGQEDERQTTTDVSCRAMGQPQLHYVDYAAMPQKFGPAVMVC